MSMACLEHVRPSAPSRRTDLFVSTKDRCFCKLSLHKRMLLAQAHDVALLATSALGGYNLNPVQ